jgi:hypothetical protein
MPSFAVSRGSTRAAGLEECASSNASFRREPEPRAINDEDYREGGRLLREPAGEAEDAATRTPRRRTETGREPADEELAGLPAMLVVGIREARTGARQARLDRTRGR